MKTDVSIIQSIIARIESRCLGVKVAFRVERDNKTEKGGRIFIQAYYAAPCTETKERDFWWGRKFYLSDHMTEDEIIKTVYLAFKLAVEHEIMESFKVDGKILFNPHIDYRALLEISDREIKREEIKTT